MALLFDDADDQHVSTGNLWLGTTSQPLTMGVWFNPDAEVRGGLAWLGASGSGNQYWLLEWLGNDASRFVSVVARAGGSSTVNSSNVAETGSWHFAAIVVASATVMNVYLDGTYTTGSTTKTPLFSNQVSFGRIDDSTPVSPFSGSLGHGCVWNVALTENELDMLYAGRSPNQVRPKSLEAHWPMYGSSDDQENTVSGVPLLREGTTDPTQATTAPPVQPYFIGSSNFFVPEGAAGGVTKFITPELSASATIDVALVKHVEIEVEFATSAAIDVALVNHVELEAELATSAIIDVDPHKIVHITSELDASAIIDVVLEVVREIAPELDVSATIDVATRADREVTAELAASATIDVAVQKVATADVKVASRDIAAITTDTTQDITISGFGDVKAYEIWVTNATAKGGAEAADSILSYGMSDGTRQKCLSSSGQDGQAVMDAQRECDSDQVVRLHDGDGATVGLATHSAFITDGIRINWSNAPPTASMVLVKFYGGDDLEVHVNSGIQSAAQNNSQSFTDAGFRPDMVLFGTSGMAAFDGGLFDHGLYQMGVAVDDSPADEGKCVATFDHHGLGTNFTSSLVSNDRVLSRWNSQSNSATYLEAGDFEANGFALIKRIDATSIAFFYMALRSTTNGMFADFIDVPTGTGSKAHTGVGFKPQSVTIVAQLITGSFNTIEQTIANSGAFAVSTFDGSYEGGLAIRIERSATTSNQGTTWHDKSAWIENGSDGLEADASFVSLDTDGYTLNYATNTTAGAHWLIIAIEESAAGGETKNISVEMSASAIIDVAVRADREITAELATAAIIDVALVRHVEIEAELATSATIDVALKRILETSAEFAMSAIIDVAVEVVREIAPELSVSATIDVVLRVIHEIAPELTASAVIDIATRILKEIAPELSTSAIIDVEVNVISGTTKIEVELATSAIIDVALKRILETTAELAASATIDVALRRLVEIAPELDASAIIDVEVSKVTATTKIDVEFDTSAIVDVATRRLVEATAELDVSAIIDVATRVVHHVSPELSASATIDVALKRIVETAAEFATSAVIDVVLKRIVHPQAELAVSATIDVAMEVIREVAPELSVSAIIDVAFRVLHELTPELSASAAIDVVFKLVGAALGPTTARADVIATISAKADVVQTISARSDVIETISSQGDLA